MNPYQAAQPGKKLMSLIGVYIAVAVMVIMSGGDATMLPVAAKEIGGLDFYSLSQTLNGVIGVAMMPLYGYLIGKNPAIKRDLYSVSIFICALAVYCRTLAHSMWLIVILGLFLGAAAPAIFVVGYSLIRDMYDIKKAGTYLGITGTMMAVGMLVGPTGTGLLIDASGWRSINYVTGSLYLISVILVFFGVKVSKEDAKSMGVSSGAFDVPGAVALIVFLGGIILTLSLGSTFAPFGGLLSNCLIGVAVAALIVLVLIIRKKKNSAILPVLVLKDRNTLCLTGINLLANFSVMAIFFFLPMYVIYVMKQSSAAAGLSITCFSILGLFLGPVFGRMIGKSGNARTIMIITTLFRIVLTACFIFIVKASTPIWIVYVIMSISGIFSSSGSVVPAVAPQIQVKPEIRQLGNSIIQVGANLGSGIGIAIYTMVIGVAGIEKGFPIACSVALGSAVLLLLISLPLQRLPASSELKRASD